MYFSKHNVCGIPFSLSSIGDVGVSFTVGNPPLPDYPASYGQPGQVDYRPEQVKVTIPDQVNDSTTLALLACWQEVCTLKSALSFI